MTFPQNYKNLKKNNKAWTMYWISASVTILYFLYTALIFIGLIMGERGSGVLAVIVVIGVIAVAIYTALAWSMLLVNSFPLFAWGITGIGALLQMDVIQLAASVIIFFTYRVAYKAVQSKNV